MSISYSKKIAVITKAFRRTGMKSLVLGVLLAVSFLSVKEIRADNATSPLGANFWFFWDNQSAWPFVDFFKVSRPLWSSGTAWSDTRTLDLDSLGYPRSLLAGQTAASLVFWSMDAQSPHPTGDFILLWDGDGDLATDFTKATVVESAPGRKVIRMLDSLDGIRIRITRTNPNNHVRNIRFICPGFEQTYQTQIFHPLFLERLKNMKALRFMDWLNTNGSVVKEFNDYTPVNYQTQNTPQGVSPWYLVQLCNRLKADMWWNMPHQASDACMRRTIEMLRDSIDPGLKIYLEWSNEVWNGMFASQGYCRTMGEAAGMGTGWSAISTYWAKRLTDMQIIAESVFARQMNRLIRVYATQVGNTGVLDGILTKYNGYQHADAIAMAPYFNASGASPSDINSILGTLVTNAAKVGQVCAGDMAIAKRYNLRPICYESGLDVWEFADSIRLKIRWNPRMKDIYLSYWNAWKAAGGQLMMQYTFCDAQWGLIRSQNQDTTLAYGWLAANEFISKNPRWWTEPTLSAQALPPQHVMPGSVRNASIRVVSIAGKSRTIQYTGQCQENPLRLVITGLDGKIVFKSAPSRINRNGSAEMNASWVLDQKGTRLAPGTYVASVPGLAEQKVVIGN